MPLAPVSDPYAFESVLHEQILTGAREKLALLVSQLDNASVSPVRTLRIIESIAASERKHLAQLRSTPNRVASNQWAVARERWGEGDPGGIQEAPETLGHMFAGYDAVPRRPAEAGLGGVMDEVMGAVRDMRDSVAQQAKPRLSELFRALERARDIGDEALIKATRRAIENRLAELGSPAAAADVVDAPLESAT